MPVPHWQPKCGAAESIRDLSNATDASGRAIFGGFKVGDPPFTVETDGSTSYGGDRGIHTVTISPSLKLQTSIDGGMVFERKRLPTAPGTPFHDDLGHRKPRRQRQDFPDDLKSAVAHISDQRSVVGAQMNKADNQRQVLENPCRS